MTGSSFCSRKIGGSSAGQWIKKVEMSPRHISHASLKLASSGRDGESRLTLMFLGRQECFTLTLEWLGSCSLLQSPQGLGVQHAVGCVRGAGVKVVLRELIMLELVLHVAQI